MAEDWIRFRTAVVSLAVQSVECGRLCSRDCNGRIFRRVSCAWGRLAVTCRGVCRQHGRSGEAVEGAGGMGDVGHRSSRVESRRKDHVANRAGSRTKNGRALHRRILRDLACWYLSSAKPNLAALRQRRAGQAGATLA